MFDQVSVLGDLGIVTVSRKPIDYENIKRFDACVEKVD